LEAKVQGDTEFTIPVQSRDDELKSMKDRSCLTVILAAGEGTRMKSRLPKVLHKVAGLPMVSHVMTAAREAGPSRIAIVVGREAELVRAAIGEEDACFFMQAERLGTAHAVLSAREQIAAGHDDIVVMFGDTPLIEARDVAALRAELSAGADIAVMGFETDAPAGYGAANSSRPSARTATAARRNAASPSAMAG
jgi:bifunctional UDP-N-acetylglucosamine pyrophosphorylase / glucosamine-1-phosphate N-acetyltransferase